MSVSEYLRERKKRCQQEEASKQENVAKKQTRPNCSNSREHDSQLCRRDGIPESNSKESDSQNEEVSELRREGREGRRKSQRTRREPRLDDSTHEFQPDSEPSLQRDRHVVGPVLDVQSLLGLENEPLLGVVGSDAGDSREHLPEGSVDE